jgi:hypothetical protein
MRVQKALGAADASLDVAGGRLYFDVIFEGAII